MASTVRNVMAFSKELCDLDDVAIHFHDTTLYVHI